MQAISVETLSPIRRSRQMRATWAAPGQARCGTISALATIWRVSMRPCPFSSVAGAVRASGGSSAGSRGGDAEGGKLAERLGDRGFHFGLVRFDHESAVAAAARDRLA